MATRTLTITHNGTDYTGEVATIESTSLGENERGMFTAYLTFSGNHWGVQAGGFNLDRPVPKFAMDHLKQILKVVGVDRWEDLAGKQAVAVFEQTGLERCVGIAHPTEDRVLIFAEHADLFPGDAK